MTLTRLVRKAGYKRNVDRAFLAGVEVRLPTREGSKAIPIVADGRREPW